MTNTDNTNSSKQDFIRSIIADDVKSNKHQGRVVTRFPPEPNGFLHIGHAKSIYLNFSAAATHRGVTHLRLDDTNPETEEEAYVEAIKTDIEWLGFDWGTHLYHASDYFDQLYLYAQELIEKSLAYVDSLSENEIREYRGSVLKPGRDSPYRNRSISENLQLFAQMKAGDFSDGEQVLRAKIDMSSSNMLMRDPVLYRIRHATHYRTQDDWCIYPLYDFTHCLSDSIEGITHSICTLEFENNRDVYDWILDNLDIPQPQPQQYEFARLNLAFTVLSKRKLLQLVEGQFVDGWDDPRMPTIAGLRRRGVPAKAVRDFCKMIGVAKTENRVDLSSFEYAVRNELNYTAPRVMCVVDPLKVIITNYDESDTTYLDAPYFPEDVGKEGTRPLPFTREILIEQSDFEENPSKGFRRLSPGEEVRLRYGYIIKCERVIKNEEGEVSELHCSYDSKTKSGAPTHQRKVKGTIHWVSATESLPAEVRLYDRLFSVSNPEDVDEDKHFTDHLNLNSLVVLKRSRIEISVASDPPEMHYQFERVGNFISDSKDSRPNNLVYNRTVTLKDTWKSSQENKNEQPAQVEITSKKKQSSRAKNIIPRPKPLSEQQLSSANKMIDQFGIPEGDAKIFARNPTLMELFRSASEETDDYNALSKWCINEIPKNIMDLDSPLSGKSVGELVKLRSLGKISSHSAKKILRVVANTGKSINEILEEETYAMIDDDQQLKDIVTEVIEGNEDAVQKYLSGKIQLLGFLVGQVMLKTGGSADPNKTRALMESSLAKLTRG
ncbi:MAG: glutamine--tRNA ligase/YqeY domain fusion protein [Gemmatimonadota bacterium]|nr:glutamine--tRNA ligase/YqeY domain fusion protein [Gemmatimonadota bacterium]